MITFAPLFPARRAPRILCVGAHPDDLEIGCGGTLLKLSSRFANAKVTWLVLTGDTARSDEANRSARALLKRFASVEVVVASFRDGFLPQDYGAVKEFFESAKRRVSPDLVFTHSLNDRHQDHRLAAELTWNTWRDCAVLEYEIPKYEGDLQAPNVHVPLTRRAARRKVDHILKHFASQGARRWFNAGVFEGHMRLRGIECNAPSGLAESFVGRKICL